jgi:hypothetical protein
MNRPALEADLTESRRQLQELLDRSEITELANRLGAWLDEKYWDEAPSILTEDAIAKTPGGSVAGDQLAQQARQNHVVPTHHMITNVLIDLDGHRATAGANLIGTFVVGPDGSGPHFQLGERYRASRRFEPGWVAALPRGVHTGLERWVRGPSAPKPAWGGAQPVGRE